MEAIKKNQVSVNTSAKMTTEENNLLRELLEKKIAEYFAPTQSNLLPQDFAAAIQEMSLKDAVQFRSIMKKGVLTPLIGWQSKDDRATTAAVQQALYAVEQAIENKANEE